MNVRTIVVVTLAVVCGLSAMVLVQAIRRPPPTPPIETVPVIFIATEVKPGETIQASMLEIRDIPKTEVPEDAIHKMPDALERAALGQLDKGDLLREKKLAEKGAGRGMAALIKPGMRAFTIQTPSFSSSLAGFLLPGNRVDVLMTANVSGGTDDESGGASTTTLLQNVEILAVHTTVNLPTSNKIDPDQARSITLLVTPEDASLLDLGQNKGTLHLSLRNLMDTGNTKPKPTTLADLQLPKNRAKPAPGPLAPMVPLAPPVKDQNPFLLIAPDMRAFSIKTPSNASRLASLIQPGSRVDVILTTNVSKESGITSTLLRNQEVLFVHPTNRSAENITGPHEDVDTITLHVTPRDAELLDLAEQTGKLNLSLRSGNATDGPKSIPVKFAELHGSTPIDGPNQVQVVVRTLRGTTIGSDLWTITTQANAARDAKVPDPPPPGIARTATGVTPQGKQLSEGAGPPP